MFDNSTLTAIVDEARIRPIPVVTHVEGEGQTALAVAAGVDEFAHAPFTEPLDDALIAHAVAPGSGGSRRSSSTAAGRRRPRFDGRSTTCADSAPREDASCTAPTSATAPAARGQRTRTRRSSPRGSRHPISSDHRPTRGRAPPTPRSRDLRVPARHRRVADLPAWLATACVVPADHPGSPHDSRPATSRPPAPRRAGPARRRTAPGSPAIDDRHRPYLDGNSLGRPTRASIERITDFLVDGWGGRLIRGWDEEWMDLPFAIGDASARA